MADQPTGTPVTQEPQAQAAQPQAPAQAPEPQPQQLPDDARAKTQEQFGKLLDSNRRLFEANELLRTELDQKRKSNETFAPVQNLPQPQKVEQVNPQDFVERDPNTGESYINEAKLRGKIDEVNQKASRAEQAVQTYIQSAEQREIDRQNKETFAVYPELNPQDSDKYDATFNRQVRGLLFDSMYNAEEYGGRPLGFKEAADLVRVQNPKVEPQKTKEELDAEKKAQQDGKDLKEQVSAGPVSQPEPNRGGSPEEELELKALRDRTRRGDNDALARRILGTDHVFSDKAES